MCRHHERSSSGKLDGDRSHRVESPGRVGSPLARTPSSRSRRVKGGLVRQRPAHRRVFAASQVGWVHEPRGIGLGQLADDAYGQGIKPGAGLWAASGASAADFINSIAECTPRARAW